MILLLILLSCSGPDPTPLPPPVLHARMEIGRMVQVPGVRGYLARPVHKGTFPAVLLRVAELDALARDQADAMAQDGRIVLAIAAADDPAPARAYLARVDGAASVTVECAAGACR